MGAGVSKVRSLKMDRKVWTETLIEVGWPLLVTYIGGLAAACISQPHLTNPSTLELDETFGIIQWMWILEKLNLSKSGN